MIYSPDPPPECGHPFNLCTWSCDNVMGFQNRVPSIVICQYSDCLLLECVISNYCPLLHMVNICRDIRRSCSQWSKGGSKAVVVVLVTNCIIPVHACRHQTFVMAYYCVQLYAYIKVISVSITCIMCVHLYLSVCLYSSQ